MDRFGLQRSRAKAEENKIKEKELDKLIPLNDLTDPYETDGGDEYTPIPAKRQKKNIRGFRHR